MRSDDLTLDELLADPLIRQVMSSDGVEERQVRELMQRVRLRRAPRSVPAPWMRGCGPAKFASLGAGG